MGCNGPRIAYTAVLSGVEDLHLADERRVDGDLADRIVLRRALGGVVVAVQLGHDDEFGLTHCLHELGQRIGRVLGNDLMDLIALPGRHV